MSEWVTFVNPGTIRNNWDDFVGAKFKVGPKQLLVTHVGRWVLPGNSQNHTLKFVTLGKDIPGAGTTVTTEGVPSGKFTYNKLPQPVVLDAHGTYYLVSKETLGGDEFLDLDTSVNTRSFAKCLGGVWYFNGEWVEGNSINNQFGPVDFIIKEEQKPLRKSTDYSYPLRTPIPPAGLEAVFGASSKLTRRVDIYEQNGTTLWKPVNSVGLISGSVSVDQTRSERRAFEMSLDNIKGELEHQAGKLWYDKIIKPYKGIAWEKDGLTYHWETQLGEFMIDEITSQDFPHTVSIQGRDYTKKLINSKFKTHTSFTRGTRVQDLIRTIAINGGISPGKIIISGPSIWNIGKDWFFDRGVDRWKAISDIAANYSIEVYFNAYGNLIIRDYQDPVETAPTFTFKTGIDGNLVHYQKSSRDSRIYNSISVSGESANTTPVIGVAENRTPGSPTNIDELGERVYTHTSAFITTQAQAVTVAKKLLAEHALEEYDVELESIGAFWLDAGDIIRFEDPDPNAGDPANFLLSSFEIPLTLGSMSYSAKRVIRVEQYMISQTGTSWERS